MQIQRKLLGWWRCTPCQQVRRDKRKLLDARFGLPLLHNFIFKKEKESAGSGEGDILALRTTTCPHFLTTIVGGATFFVPFYRHIQIEGANIHGERGGKLPSYFQRHDLPPFFFPFLLFISQLHSGDVFPSLLSTGEVCLVLQAHSLPLPPTHTHISRGDATLAQVITVNPVGRWDD